MIKNSKDANIQGNTIAQWRISAIRESFANWTEEPIPVFNKEESKTILPLIIEKLWSFPKRYVELDVAIDTLLENDNYLSSAILARSLIETIGMGCLFIDKIESLVMKGDYGNLFRTFEKHYCDSNIDTPSVKSKAMNVMDSVRYLGRVIN